MFFATTNKKKSADR